MTFTVLIPARYASSRLPGKPLRELAGKPMIQWVVEAAQKSKASRVVVATDHDDIARCVNEFGGEAVMTSTTHVSGTDRLQEAAQMLGLAERDCVVNVQGDEPLVPANVIDQVADNLINSSWAEMATLCEKIQSTAEFLNPNAVKVVFDEKKSALYFSRAPIPVCRDEPLSSTDSVLPEQLVAHRHLGIYAYRVGFLNKFVHWPEHPLEQCEKLEQLRALAHGVTIHVEPSCCTIPAGVDTEEDLNSVDRYLRSLHDLGSNA
ncbi:MAG: 3-deoxy-manno-octulosonate cytidylyltransferase [Pseudomonadales bacterium]